MVRGMDEMKWDVMGWNGIRVVVMVNICDRYDHYHTVEASSHHHEDAEYTILYMTHLFLF